MNEKEEMRMIMCEECGKLFNREEMIFSHDCHGIPFRLLCASCVANIYETKGYDGEYYTELDENINNDW